MQDITSSANFLLAYDIDELHHICLTSKQHFNYCNNQNFWKLKFKYDKLPLLLPYPTTMTGWIQKYKSLKKYLDESVIELEDVLTDFVGETLKIINDDDNEDLSKQFSLIRQYLLDRVR